MNTAPPRVVKGAKSYAPGALLAAAEKKVEELGLELTRIKALVGQANARAEKNRVDVLNERTLRRDIESRYNQLVQQHKDTQLRLADAIEQIQERHAHDESEKDAQRSIALFVENTRRRAEGLPTMYASKQKKPRHVNIAEPPLPLIALLLACSMSV